MRVLLRSITVTVVITLMVFGFVSWRFWDMNRDFMNKVRKDLQLQSLTDEIVHLGEVLTMSSRMAVTTGDLNWETHYDEFLPQQSTSIRGLLELTPEEDRAKGILSTYKANVDKVAIERKSIDLVKSGKVDEASELLSSGEYERLRKTYKKGIAQHDVNLHEKVESRLKDFKRRGTLFGAIVFAGVLLLTFFWMVILFLVNREFSERKKAGLALRKNEQKLRKIIDLVPHMIFAKNKSGEFILANEAMAKAYGKSIPELIGTNQKELHASAEEVEDYLKDDLSVIRNNKSRYIAAQSFLDAEGRERVLQTLKIPFQLTEEEDMSVLGVAVDITEQKKAEEKLFHSAFYDTLTGLPTRSLFIDRLSEALSEAKRDENYHFAVYYVDLDRFKIINDSLGHLIGDQLLINVGLRLQKQLKEISAIARVGGDEFALLVEGVSHHDEAMDIAEKIRVILEEPFYLSKNEVFTSTSIGIVFSDRAYKNATDIIRGADTAMYVAKANGRRHAQIFSRGMHEIAVAKLELESDLRNVIEREELVVYYQPIMSAPKGTIVGFESLIRWDHTEQGMISPDAFIPVAEESGMIIPIGWWTVSEVCRQLLEWKSLLPAGCEFYASVNISGKQLQQSDFIVQLKKILDKHQMDVNLLKFEITENILLDNNDIVLSNIKALKTLNIELFMDDFGTGYSSLSLLRSIDVDKLKIDKSFVHGFEAGGENLEIVQGVVALAHNLGISVIAEGVETPETLDKLREIGCDFIQGYFYSKPLKAESIPAFVERNI